MPIYEYACDSCHTRFEVQQKMSDPPVATCSKCGNAVKKLISPPAIMFKGTGWYVTDYSDKMKPPASAEGNEGKPKADTKTAGETKPAATESGNGTASAASSTSTASPSGGTSSGGSSTSSTPAGSGSSGST